MKSGKLYGVGIGPGDPQYLTLRAADILSSVDIIFTVISQNAKNSTSQHVVEYLKPRGEIRLQTFSMSTDKVVREAQVKSNAHEIIKALQAGYNCAFATLGDAMTYSTFGYVYAIIKDTIPDLELEIVPGITSFATLAAKAASVLVENGEQLRIIPSFMADTVQYLDFPRNSTTILLKTYRNRKEIVARLQREDNIDIIYGEHLTMNEQILLSELESISKRPETYLSLIMVKKK